MIITPLSSHSSFSLSCAYFSDWLGTKWKNRFGIYINGSFFLIPFVEAAASFEVVIFLRIFK